MLCKRIEALVRERAQRQREFGLAFERAQLLASTHDDGFTGAIQGALTELEPPSASPRES
jgi:hypothetical protein